MSGVLYVVATPIGNLQDITFRAVEVLQRVDKIAAEDTRHAGALLNHYAIQKPTLSLHEFNERERVNQVLTLLQQGESIALISDAGTPLISDPGYHVIKAAKAEGISVVPLPGPCAAITALSAAGLPTDRFIFEGFLPAKAAARQQALKVLARESRTLIFYEAPHRLVDCLTSLVEVFGSERKAVVARELTKLYESIKQESLRELLAYYTAHTDECRGECVVLVEGHQSEALETVEVEPEAVLDALLAALPVKQAAALASQITGVRKNLLYEMALKKKS